MNSYSESYKAAGVDVTAGYRAVELMRGHIAKTHSSQVLTGIGGFGGLFELDLRDISRPVMVSGTDGVGTKLKIAFALNIHSTIGIDCVAMCVNDIICCGAKPLYFLDYIATGKIVPEKIGEIVEGVSHGCNMAGCSLIGGETAEMPGFYPDNEYDIAGFCTGIVSREKIIDAGGVIPGDIIIALPSSGVHSNGFSLVRKLVLPDDLASYSSELSKTIGEELLTPTTIYVDAISTLKSAVEIKSIAHITGGGFYENIPRALPHNTSAKIYREAVRVLPIFNLLQQKGDIPIRDMYNTFNMGVGMCAVVSKNEADAAVAALCAAGTDAYILGEVIAGDGTVKLC